MKKVYASLLILMMFVTGFMPVHAINSTVRIMDLTHLKGVYR